MLEYDFAVNGSVRRIVIGQINSELANELRKFLKKPRPVDPLTGQPKSPEKIEVRDDPDVTPEIYGKFH